MRYIFPLRLGGDPFCPAVWLKISSMFRAAHHSMLTCDQRAPFRSHSAITALGAPHSRNRGIPTANRKEFDLVPPCLSYVLLFVLAHAFVVVPFPPRDDRTVGVKAGRARRVTCCGVPGLLATSPSGPPELGLTVEMMRSFAARNVESQKLCRENKLGDR